MMDTVTKKVVVEVDFREKNKQFLKNMNNTINKFMYNIKTQSMANKASKKGLFGPLAMPQDEWRRVMIQGKGINAFTGTLPRLSARLRMATAGLKGFRMEMLGVMFFGMMLQRSMMGLLQPAAGLFGLGDLWRTTLEVVFLPLMEDIFPFLLKTMDKMMNWPDWLKRIIGWFVVLGVAIGTVLYLIGALSLGLGSTIIAGAGIFAGAMTVMANSVWLLIGPIGILIMLMSIFAYVIYKNWDIIGPQIANGFINIARWAIAAGKAVAQLAYSWANWRVIKEGAGPGDTAWEARKDAAKIVYDLDVLQRTLDDMWEANAQKLIDINDNKNKTTEEQLDTSLSKQTLLVNENLNNQMKGYETFYQDLINKQEVFVNSMNSMGNSIKASGGGSDWNWNSYNRENPNQDSISGWLDYYDSQIKNGDTSTKGIVTQSNVFNISGTSSEITKQIQDGLNKVKNDITKSIKIPG